MSRVFIFDCQVERIRQLTQELTRAGHEVASNMESLYPSELNLLEFGPTAAVHKLWTVWNGEIPHFLIMECLDIDSEKFLEELNKPFYKKDIQVILMTTHHARANTRLQRLMARYNAYCVEWPVDMANFLAFTRDPVLSTDVSRHFLPGVVFNRK